MANTNEIEAFLAEVTEENKDSGVTARFINRDRLDAKIDDDTGYSSLFNGYLMEGFTPGIEGDYGESTAVRMIEPEGGRRMTLWLSGFEQEHFKNAVSKWTEDGATYPMEVSFLRHKVPSKNGRVYNRWSGRLMNSGADITVPPVPEDQYQVATEE